MPTNACIKKDRIATSTKRTRQKLTAGDVRLRKSDLRAILGTVEVHTD